MKFANYYLQKERDNRLIRECLRNDYYFANRMLCFFDRYALNYVENLIYKITYKIENESGWEYRGHSFYRPSNFRLDDGQIVFDEHSFCHPYTYRNGMSEEESFFLEKYVSLLNRLSRLEEKRDFYIQKAKERYPNVIIFRKRKSQTERNCDYLTRVGYIGREADCFVQTYSQKGVEKVISLLNLISSSDSVTDAYEKIKDMGYSYSYLSDLLRWCSMFSKGGNIIYEKHKDSYIKTLLEEGSVPNSFKKNESDIFLYHKNRKD